MQVHGIVQDKNGKTWATLIGKWDESMHYVTGDGKGKGKESDSLLEPHLLWKRSKPAQYPTRYNLTRLAITLNELTPGLKVCTLFFVFEQRTNSSILVDISLNKQEKLPPTDSRLRPDQRYLENGNYEMADSEKLRLEQRQRQV